MCRDPFLAGLEEFGYSVVRLPVSDLEPLELLRRDGDDLERFGRLTTVFEPRDPVGRPRVTRGRPAASISGRRTGRIEVGAGLSLLGGVIAAMGGSRIGIEDTYHAARGITFEFREVTEDRAELAALDRWLASARLRDRAASAAALVEAGTLYVTTVVIRSRSLTVEAHDEQGAALSVEAPALAHAADGRVHVSHDADNAAAVTYTGRVPLAFGFRAVRLHYRHGRYAGSEPLDAGDAGLRILRRAPGAPSGAGAPRARPKLDRRRAQTHA
jgi:hypothetical protein